MTKYGYIGPDDATPTQSWGSNAGVFSPTDVYNLQLNDKWSSIGSLELIETQTSADFTNMDFTNLGNYDIHFLTHNNSKPADDAGTDTEHFSIRLSNDGGSSFITSGYHKAWEYGDSGASFTQQYGTSENSFSYLNGYTNYDYTGGGYVYFYDLLDSSKYSFISVHGIGNQSSTVCQMRFGSGVYPVSESHDAIRIGKANWSEDYSGTFSLYGLRYK